MIRPRRPPKLLSSSCSTQHARQAAAWLLEFSHPGQRRIKILNESPANLPGAVKKSTRYKNKGPTHVIEFPFLAKRYQSDLFQQYAAGAAREMKMMMDGDGDDDDDNEILLPTRDNPAIKKGVRSELKIAQQFWSWIHHGDNGCWLGNTRILRVTKIWLESDDESRQRALFETDACLQNKDKDKDNVLAETLVHALGRDYEMRIHKQMRRLEWLSRTTQLNDHKRSTNFLSVGEALYIDELLKVKRPTDRLQMRERVEIPGLKW